MNKKETYADINSKVIDGWIKDGWVWGRPISHETFMKAKKGKWDILLSPNKKMPHSWLPSSLKGKEILGLASGGAQQMPILSALGGVCTVLDYSKEQLDSEERFALKEGYTIKTVRADMSKGLPFEDESFDIVINPVSNCYIEEVKPLFKEVFRVLRKGGIFIAGLDNGMNFITDDEEVKIVNKLPFNPLKNKEYMDLLMKNNDGVQFSHTGEEQIGGQLEAGFVLTDLYEDANNEGRLKELNIPSFYVTRAIKKDERDSD